MDAFDPIPDRHPRLVAWANAMRAVDFPREGGFRLVLGDPIPVAASGINGANEWDVVLPS